ncbi:AAA family ATPase [Nocardia higoensis]|uniref:AAA family ATPase n=1 Tax=Nocardia higoensis TaxID=228599 RepID=A0ABS0DI12_9NOCA|nr:AAA family ATPase [Nocardia higoensis]MBF6358096.1 AAA family ATPase [Nocardia higoensis]
MSNEHNNERHYDETAEMQLLGAVLTAPDEVQADFLSVPLDAWYTRRAQQLAGLLHAMLQSGEPVNPNTVLMTAMNRGLVANGMLSGDYIFTCTQGSALAPVAPLAAERIVHLHVLRKMWQASTTVAQRVESSWSTGIDRLDTFEHISTLKTALEDIDRDLTTNIDAPKTLNEFLAERTDETNTRSWLVPGLLQRMDRVILTGQEGLGKSQLLAQWGIAMAIGQHPFTGRPLPAGTPPSRVLVVDVENAKHQLQDRYARIQEMFVERRRDFGMGPADWDNFKIARPRPGGINLLDGRDAAWVESQIADAAPDVLIFGSLYKAHNTNPNDEQPARNLAAILDRWRERYDLAILTEAHANKSTNSSGHRNMEPNGSSVWLRWPEYGYGLRRAQEDAGERDKVTVADVVAWRGARSSGRWPLQFQRSHLIPWMPADPDYSDGTR